MNQSEYARHRGIDESTVREYIDTEKITFEALVKDPKTKFLLIDSDIADEELDLFLDQSRRMGVVKEHRERFQASKADTETLKARKLELEIAEREGRLLDAEDVRKTITRLVGETRETILNVASKIAPELVSMTDVVEIENKIADELNVALENLSRL